MRTISQTISSLQQLGEYILSFPEELLNIMAISKQYNGWFTIENQKLALTAIANEMLNKEKLEEFVNNYSVPVQQPKKVAIIMAGNLPLVGFHDLVSVLLAGHTAIVKLSSKDDKLPKAIILKLYQLDESFKESVIIQDHLVKDFEAVIATGSNNSARYFEEYFGKYPNIIRKNRSSIAILTGEETDEELRLLGNDIFQYFGLGCRNVTKLFVPKGYNFDQFLTIMNEFSSVISNSKYKNNFDYNLTLFIINGLPYKANDCLIITDDKSLNSRIAVLHYQEYDSMSMISDWMIDHKDELQVVVGKEFTPFGTAQQPNLSDFADNIDTMEFLSSI